MGDIVRQDQAYTIQVVLKVVDMYEQEWQKKGYDMSLHSLSACMFVLVCCLGCLRRYEGMWTDLAALRYDVEYCEDLEDESAVS